MAGLGEGAEWLGSAKAQNPPEPARSAGWQWVVKVAGRALSQVACVVCTRPGDYGALRIATVGLEVRGGGGRVQGPRLTPPPGVS